MCTAAALLPAASAFTHRQPKMTTGGGEPSTSLLSGVGAAPSHALSSFQTSIPSLLQNDSLRRELPSRQQLDFDHNLRPSTFNFALHYQRPSKKYDIDLTALPSDSADDVIIEAASEPSTKSSSSSSSTREDIKTTVTLVGAQSLLLPLSYLLARAFGLPNGGLGAGFEWSAAAVAEGLRWTTPLFAAAAVMRFLEPHSQSLRDVTRATQRSVLAVMGRERRPVYALAVSILLGAAAGWGEEWLFRGVFQTVIADKLSSESISLAVCGVVFGLLHAVTPLYAILAGLASVFFGYMYNVSNNLAVPIICHAVYDVGALVYAHWSVTGLTAVEQDEIEDMGPGAPIMKEL